MVKFSVVTPFLLVLMAGACDADFARSAEGQGGAQSSRTSAQALRSASIEQRLRAFYTARDWRPAWSASQADLLLAAFRDVERHGIDAGRFDELLGAADDPTEREFNLTRAALAYGEALANGLVDPAEVEEIYTLPRNDLDVAASLNAALDGGKLRDWLQGLAPGDAEYRALSQAYLRNKARIGQAESAPIPDGPMIRPGRQDARIPLIAEALRQEGYFTGQLDGARPNTYTADLATAVMRLQEENGLRADGVLGRDALRALNRGPSDRAQQLALNMERRRWLQRQPAATRIDVNIAGAVLRYYRDGSEAHTARVITGAADTPTPSLGSSFDQLVVNPPWNVPQGIAAKEILPKGPSYLASKNMYVEAGRVVQRPGPDSSLGLVKFDMQNRYAIYLHDTPAKALFANAQRQLSHGCVRVEDAVGFARLLARDSGVLAEFEQRLASGETSVVKLRADIPVRLLYHTAFLSNGEVIFRPDVYGSDAKLARALGMGAYDRRGGPVAIAATLGP